MTVIDSHQHYWAVAQFAYGFTKQGVPALDRDYLPVDLEPQMEAAGVDHSVLVQVLHTEDETRWMIGLAREHPSIAGVVGWVDLTEEPAEVDAALDRLADPLLVGIRHLVHEEPDTDWIVRPDVMRGLAVLEGRAVPFDLLFRPPHFPHLSTLSERLPGLRMVIDHLAKPYIREARLQPWAAQMHAAAANPNVWCKLSGMITEADHDNWRPSDLAPYVETALQAFGPDRVMFGSDWPVCTLAGSYSQVIMALREVLDGIESSTEAAIFGGNAAAFYRLPFGSQETRP
jgi:L-fuconolactonase